MSSRLRIVLVVCLVLVIALIAGPVAVAEAITPGPENVISGVVTLAGGGYAEVPLALYYRDPADPTSVWSNTWAWSSTNSST